MSKYYDDAILPVRSMNGVWWMLRGRVRLLRSNGCLVGSIGVRHHRAQYLDDRSFAFNRWSMTFRIGRRR